jgi:hypothetical protein
MVHCGVCECNFCGWHVSAKINALANALILRDIREAGGNWKKEGGREKKWEVMVCVSAGVIA